MDQGTSLEKAVNEGLAAWRLEHGKYIPGFGHRFHKEGDPRAPCLMAIVREEQELDAVSGEYVAIGEEIDRQLSHTTRVPMNIDGATAVIFAELGCEPPLARGLFCLSRSVGILAHAWEQTQQGGRNKGPTPPKYLYTYTG